MEWILAYTLWNFTFICGSRPPDVSAGALAGAALIHLGAPWVATGTDGRTWLELRAFALLWVVAFVTGAPHAPFVMDTYALYARPVADVLALASGIAAAMLFYRRGLLRGVTARWRGSVTA